MSRHKIIALLFSLALVITACSATPEEYISRGDRLAAEGDYTAAALNYRKAIQGDPDAAAAYLGLGLAAIELEDPVEAFAALSRAVQLDPGDMEAKARLGGLCISGFLAGQAPVAWYEVAVNTAEDLLGNDPGSFDGLRLKGYIAFADKRFTESIEFFEAALESRPGDPLVTTNLVQAFFAVGRHEEGERLASELIGRAPDYGEIYDVLYRRYVGSGRLALAQEILERRVEANPAVVEHRIALAMHHARRQDGDAMQAVLRDVEGRAAEFQHPYLHVGDFYAQLGDPETALAKYREGLKAADKDSKLEYEKRIIGSMMALGQTEQALSTMDQAMWEGPDDDIRAARASLLLNGGPEELAQAIGEYRNLLRRRPDDLRVRLGLAQALSLSGNLSEAREQFQQILSLTDRMPGAHLGLAQLSLRQNRYEGCVQHARDYLASFPSNMQGRLLHAACQAGAGNLAEASRDLSRLEAAAPNSREVQLQTGLVRLAEGRLQEADQAFTKAHRPGQGDLRPLAGLVESRIRKGDYDQALGLLAREAETSVDEESVRLTLASTAARVGRTDIAIEQYQKLLEIDPKSAGLHLRLGQIYQGTGDKNRALQHLQKAHELQEGDVPAAVALASLLYENNQTGEAVSVLRGNMKAAPGNPLVLNNLAFILAESERDLDEALDLAQLALSSSPGNAAIEDTLGWVYLKRRQVDSALHIFEGIAKKHPDNPVFRYHLGSALLMKGDESRAKAELERALAGAREPKLKAEIKELIAKIGRG